MLQIQCREHFLVSRDPIKLRSCEVVVVPVHFSLQLMRLVCNAKSVLKQFAIVSTCRHIGHSLYETADHCS